ncbi:MAG: 50S ribosomal protein L11 methyltransferase [Verrucomicrobiales bacterium]|nr:50S ribosomal protein L11 methyltransferase [Verrucomicrobiales bacterium]
MWALSVTVRPEGDEAVGELLARLTGQSAVATHDKRSGLATVVAYVESSTFFTGGRRRELTAGLERMKEFGLDLGRPKVRWARVPKADWAESWKRHFQPIEVGKRLLVRPSWSRRRPAKGQVEVVLDPGLSFGTGQHPTTDFCLRELVRLRKASDAAGTAMMDVGTGSGILAIAAAKLGYRPVTAFDFDPEAVGVARRNAADNGVAREVSMVRRDVATLKAPKKGKCAVVCANLTADLLHRHAELLLSQVVPGGYVVLAGILAEEFVGIQRRFEALGARRVRDRRKSEWRSGSFRKDT